MSLKNINPTKTKSWKKLSKHFEQVKSVSIKKLFLEDKNRKDKFSISLEDLSLDYSKNNINRQTIDLLLELTREIELEDAIEKQFSAEKINQTENRAVLHTALRDSTDKPIILDGQNAKPLINSTLLKLREFSEKIISGRWKGYTAKPITDIVNIGIGGSHLGADMVLEGLRFCKNHLKTHFISNIDGDYISDILKNLNPETTLFIVVSKTFTTVETITNANTVKDWFLQSACKSDMERHFVAVSNNNRQAEEFGIDKSNIFPIWDWVGGRFSLWSSAGLVIILSIGFENFKSLLNGAEAMDKHFKNTDFRHNIPVIMALIDIWYNNFFNAQTRAVLCYSQYLEKFVPYLQQVTMESNGKNTDRNGKKVDYNTGAIIWGGVGTTVQHSFMQLLHQGTRLVTVDFIGFRKPVHNHLFEHHKQLMANYFAQMDALAFGREKSEKPLELKSKREPDFADKLSPFRTFEANKPSNALLFEKLSPKSLGELIALYEHKTFVQGIIWNINSYDQFGVELGKELAIV